MSQNIQKLVFFNEHVLQVFLLVRKTTDNSNILAKYLKHSNILRCHEVLPSRNNIFDIPSRQIFQIYFVVMSTKVILKRKRLE